ncbi:aspartate aminotransferase family protein [Metabacillus sediminilitoris]|uniref:Aspartate aminotransferase family protein n=1 Tax=Metabacillus sediminilitoris TaxID=2567941 RepID=A0A4S4C428_9BACI|nr:aspartate aminotransferase family protein [Metabacillus sediminilitoris]QGQ45246.1 aminotransferase class III-fold pyridoxal phosphate-dependent enzyme [Metabacillus sediminilitoris]THF82455.1 aspartate aminotransferase family protein [Metabacillus sediminilitoris]
MPHHTEDIRLLEELDKKHFLHPTSSIQQQQDEGPAFIFKEGRGIYLEDVKGNIVIDGMSSLWNVNVGHGREELGEVAKAQMTKLAYTSSFATFSNEPAIRLSAKLAELAPGDLCATFFTSGGSEANDTAYKLARHYWILKGEPERKKIISRTKSYHGVSMGATSATGLKPFRDFTSSLAPDFFHVDHHDPVALRDLIEAEGPETIAAFITEPVQGAGGVHIAQANYFKEVKAICDMYGILFITDEVITGFGRTGKWFGIEHNGITPDMMCFAKGVTSGYAQLGGVMLSKELHDDFKKLSTGPLLHGYTYSGHAMACAVALKNIELIEKENLVENAKLKGGGLVEGLHWLQENKKMVSKVRGLGLMAAIELSDENLKKVQIPISSSIVNEAAKRGLICRSVTFDGQDTIVLAPPLIIKKEEIEKVVLLLHDAIDVVERKK